MIYDLYFRTVPRRPGRKSLLSAAAQWLQSVRSARNLGKGLTFSR